MLRIATEQLQSSPTTELDSEPPPLVQLLEDWTQAKQDELSANQRRAAIEQQMALLLTAPEEGQKTTKVGAFRVVRTNKVNYSGSLAKVLELAQELELPDLTKQSLDETKLKRLRRDDPTAFELLVAEGAIKCANAKPHFDVARVPVAEPVP